MLSSEVLRNAVNAISSGQCIVIPTDTVYGIAADPSNPEAVARLLAAKRRGRNFPVPLLIGDNGDLDSIAKVDERARRLAEEFWPGALTLILPQADGLTMDLGDAGQTIAVRLPHHEITREILRATGPLAVSSANIHDMPPATTVAQAQEMLADSVALYIDGGQCLDEVPSTIVDVAHATIVRHGAIGDDEIRPFLEGARA